MDITYNLKPLPATIFLWNVIDLYAIIATCCRLKTLELVQRLNLIPG